MELKTVITCTPLSVVFVSSGLLINLIQAICFVTIRPISKNTFRKVNGLITQFLWMEIIWLMERWAGFKIELHTDKETLELMGKEHALVMPNHMCDLDIFISMLLAWRAGCIRSALMVVKKSSQYLPIFGWASWFSEFLLLDRRWDKDEKNLKASFDRLKDYYSLAKKKKDYYRPFWLTIFVEGTRLTQDKLAAAQEFAILKGMHVPKNVLIPRTKGFVYAVQHLRSFVPAIYDVTMAPAKGYSTPSLLKIFAREPLVVKVHIRRHSMERLPQCDADIAQWCRDKFLEKDAMLDKYRAEGKFETLPVCYPTRSKMSLVVMDCLVLVYIIGALALCLKTSILTTWKGIASTITGLSIAAAMIHAYIEYAKLPPGTMSPLDNNVK